MNIKTGGHSLQKRAFEQYKFQKVMQELDILKKPELNLAFLMVICYKCVGDYYVS